MENILIIEDSESDRKILGRILQSSYKNCRIRFLNSGQHVMESIRPDPPDLILLDINMQGKDGFEVLKDIKASDHHAIPVLLVSVFTHEHDKLKGLQLGATDFINKPIVPEEVKARVAVQLKMKKGIDDLMWAAQKTNEGIRLLYKELERKNLELKKQDELKDEFLGNVSHELRTPLAVIYESISQMADGLLGPTTEKQKKFLMMSLKNIDRLKNMIDNLLDIAKIEKGKMEIFKENVNMVELIEEVVAQFLPRAQAKGLKLSLQYARHQIQVLADKEKIIQVLNNLIGNALKFTQKGFIDVSLEEGDGSVVCRIRDTGIGIEAKDIPKLFSKFEQIGRLAGPGEKGTGLGLAIVKGIVELHGGEIAVESLPREGSMFSFTLPQYAVDEGILQNVFSALREAMKQYSYFSVIRVGLAERAEEISGSQTGIEDKLFLLEDGIRQCLLRKADRIVRVVNGVYCLLPDTEKAHAHIVAKRIRERIDVHRGESPGSPWGDWRCGLVTFPEDGLTEDELLVKLESQVEVNQQ